MADDTSRLGNRYCTPELLTWVEGVHAPHDEALEQAFTAPGQQGMPAIMVGPSEGRALELLARMVGARRIVEVGTLAGYSTIWLARALGPGGKLWTLESEPAHAEVARRSLERAGLGASVEILVGPALDTLPTIERHGPFDVVFVDADKASYDRYGQWAAAHVRPGGLLLGDNAYLFGELLGDSDRARAMRRFHEAAREYFHTVCLPTPDGLLLGVRKAPAA